MYIVIVSDEDGIYVAEFDSAEALSSEIAEEGSGYDTVKWLADPDALSREVNVGIIVKGEVVIPKPVTQVTKWEV